MVGSAVENGVMDTEAQFVSIGLSEQKAKETAKNAALSKALVAAISEAHEFTAELSKAQGILLYHVATRLKAQCQNRRKLLIRHVCNQNIRNEPQLSAALDYLLSQSSVRDDAFSETAFLKACGAGVVVTPDEIEQAVSQAMKLHERDIIEQRYSFGQGKLMAEVKRVQRWAENEAVRREIELQLVALLGAKTEEEIAADAAPSKTAKRKSKRTVDAEPTKTVQPSTGSAAPPPPLDEDGAFAETDGAATIDELMKSKLRLHNPGENYTTEGYVVNENTDRLLKQHLKETGGMVVTRFPPEPNGILHIGHAKAINVNFGYAQAKGGICYLRYDDTNPEKEEERFFTAIKEMVEWLGYTPYKVTHASDYFDQLYEWGEKLINKGLGYVCHQKADEMKGFNPPPSPWRDRPIEESLKLFRDMKNGKFEEGEATMRMKVTLEEGKQDPVAYRIKYTPHHRSGDKWCIYPTYDYTHCLCDSIENISHSLCTKEFQSRRSSYYWLCNALDIYCPVQWEYGRLNMNYTVVSKRKILQLISNNIVRAWDDPRLFTLPALRRRGVPAEAINNFVARMGVSAAQAVVDPAMLNAATRDLLNHSAPRTMAVLDPLLVRVSNWDDSVWPTELDVPDLPLEPEKGSHRVQFRPEFYIEASDFKENGEKGFKRLTKDQSVGLKYIGSVLKLKRVEKDASGAITMLEVTMEKVNDTNKPKSFIHWVADPFTCEVRLYDRLFLHKHPEDQKEVPGGFVTDCNPVSLTVVPNAFVDRSLKGAAVLDKVQFERIGFFSVDYDSTPSKLVFNRTVSLKEDAGKTS